MGEAHAREGEPVRRDDVTHSANIQNSNSPSAVKTRNSNFNQIPNQPDAVSSNGPSIPIILISKSPLKSVSSTQLVPESPNACSNSKPTSQNPTFLEALVNPLTKPSHLSPLLPIHHNPSTTQPIMPLTFPAPVNRIASNSSNAPGPKTLIPTNQEVDDDISADEDYAIGLESFQLQDHRQKGVEKGKIGIPTRGKINPHGKSG